MYLKKCMVYRLLCVIASVGLFAISTVQADNRLQTRTLDSLSLSDSGLKACLSETARAKDWMFVADVTELDCSNRQIEYLQGIAALDALQMLNLANNKISNTDELNDLDQMVSLDLSGNDLYELSGLKNFRLLTHFNVSGNRNLPFSVVSELIGRNQNLIDLKLADIYIGASFPLFNSTEGILNLTALDLSRTGVNHVESLLPYTKLQSLSLSGNQLISTDGLNNLENLTALDISDNEHVYIPDNQFFPLMQKFTLTRNGLPEQGKPLQKFRSQSSQPSEFGVPESNSLPEHQCNYSMAFYGPVISSGGGHFNPLVGTEVEITIRDCTNPVDLTTWSVQSGAGIDIVGSTAGMSVRIRRNRVDAGGLILYQKIGGRFVLYNPFLYFFAVPAPCIGNINIGSYEGPYADVSQIWQRPFVGTITNLSTTCPGTWKAFGSMRIVAGTEASSSVKVERISAAVGRVEFTTGSPYYRIISRSFDEVQAPTCPAASPTIIARQNASISRPSLYLTTTSSSPYYTLAWRATQGASTWTSSRGSMVAGNRVGNVNVSLTVSMPNCASQSGYRNILAQDFCDTPRGRNHRYCLQ